MGKSQLIHNNEFHLISKAEIRKATGKLVESLNLAAGSTAVSYTHLTLPTIHLV